MLTAHKQPLEKDGISNPMLDPTMRGEIGFPRKGPVGRVAWLGCRACWRGAAGGGGGAGGAGGT